VPYFISFPFHSRNGVIDFHLISKHTRILSATLLQTFRSHFIDDWRFFYENIDEESRQWHLWDANAFIIVTFLRVAYSWTASNFVHE